ncbi:PREDICTED: ATPase inhibitor, mitochondrial [Chaetura pelagica]|uniref:ATPase inhibitor, mitochondrial n=1 Tax=Chaetura pelagica TaxID=8897 RepID=UPI00052382D5|nr:PREDICTED: ATPase inhibitor, mitochondrial [Chaetura pelagica]
MAQRPSGLSEGNGEKEREQLSALRKHHEEEIDHHQKEIERLQKEIERHKYKIKKLKNDN